MLKNFQRVSPTLYRSSAPTAKDIAWLHNKAGITRIISLDAESAKKIALACKLFHIEHIIVPIDFSRASIIKLLSKIDDLFESKEKTLVHCFHGRDRCGLFIALYRRKIDGWSAEKAIKEADKFGFCAGLDSKMTKLYHSIIEDAGKTEEDVLEAYDFDFGGNYGLPGGGAYSTPYEGYGSRNYPGQVKSDFYDRQYGVPVAPSTAGGGVREWINEEGHTISGIPQEGIYQGLSPGSGGAGLTFPLGIIPII